MLWLDSIRSLNMRIFETRTATEKKQTNKQKQTNKKKTFCVLGLYCLQDFTIIFNG